MAIKCQRWYFKYAKCLIITVLVVFFSQLYLALRFFPSENDNTIYRTINLKKQSSFRKDEGAVSARKFNNGLGDDEDFSQKNSKDKKDVHRLRTEELDFKIPCDINNREAISAIHRAKTQTCKQQIVNKTCLIQNGKFYAKNLPNSCPNKKMTYGKYLGCYQDEKKLRLFSNYYSNFGNTNSPTFCLDVCIQAGFSYSGVQYASECFCGESAPPESSRILESSCNMKCPGDQKEICGGYFAMNVYETGLSKFTPQTPSTYSEKEVPVRIVFLLTLNGRALRQVHRLINALFRSTHYYYIHVDSRQDYLHRELKSLERQFPNIRMASERFSTIWGGASLLQMLLTSMRDFFALGWQWDFVINLSESDFPIKSLENLEKFLSSNKGLNFVKSHGREVQRFVKKQGLDKTFIECDTHMWRVGDRKLPKGIIIDGGSDWIALSPEFVSYVTGEKDELLLGLDTIFKHTLLPAESFFHTALRNSKFCNTYVDNNLHVTNWKRKLGCKCQYKHVVDWCGCSPNDFKADDWPRIQSTQDRQLFFARKFEPIINQEIITRVEQAIGLTDHHLVENLESYWQTIYNKDDMTSSTDDTILTHAESMVRHNADILHEEECFVTPGEIVEINSYHYSDIYKGNLILHKCVLENNIEVLLETWYKPQNHLEVTKLTDSVDYIKIFKVSSDYDQKEQTFRNLGNIIGPFTELTLLYHFTESSEIMSNLTLVWLDPAAYIADVNMLYINENNLTNFVKPSFKTPILPGVWRVGLFDKKQLLAQTKFLVTPLEYLSGNKLTPQESSIIHSGSHDSYKDNSNILIADFLPDPDNIHLFRNLAQANVKRLGQDLLDWIDSLSYKFYDVLGSCVNLVNHTNVTCGRHKFNLCSSTKWSSLAPDPKGRIGKLNLKTGRLERV